MARNIDITGFKMDYKGVGRLLKSDDVAKEIARRAEAVATAARASAPVDKGDYQASITVEMDETDRAVARIVSDDPAAIVIESEVGNLARALDAAGYDTHAT